MQGLFFHLLPLFFGIPILSFMCVQTKQIQGVIKRPRRERRGRERTEKRERKRERERFARGRGRRTRSLSSLSHFLFFLIASLGRGYCSLSSSGLSSFLSLSFRSCPRSALFFPAECSAAAETSRETRRKRPKSSIHSDANADAFRFLSAGQRGRVFCSFHLALDDRRRHAASAE